MLVECKISRFSEKKFLLFTFVRKGLCHEVSSVDQYDFGVCCYRGFTCRGGFGSFFQPGSTVGREPAAPGAHLRSALLTPAADPWKHLPAQFAGTSARWIWPPKSAPLPRPAWWLFRFCFTLPEIEK